MTPRYEDRADEAAYIILDNLEGFPGGDIVYALGIVLAVIIKYCRAPDTTAEGSLQIALEQLKKVVELELSRMEEKNHATNH